MVIMNFRRSSVKRRTLLLLPPWLLISWRHFASIPPHSAALTTMDQCTKCGSKNKKSPSVPVPTPCQPLHRSLFGKVMRPPPSNGEAAVLSQKQESPDAKDDSEASQGSETEQACQEAAWVERKGDLLILHFKCPCGKGYQILLSGNDCYYKLTSF